MRAIVAGIECVMVDLSLDYSGVKIPSFQVTIPAHYFDTRAKRDALLFEPITIRDRGELVVSGIVAELPKPEMKDGIILIKLTCDDGLGYLYLEMAANLQFQNVSISTAIGLLLAEAQDTSWTLITTTLTDDTITCDPRNRETLWAQIEAIRKVAGTPFFVRYRGMSGNDHQIEIGSFGTENRRLVARKGENVVGNPKYSQPARLPIKEIRPISGKAGGSPVSLSDALNLDATLSSDPDYPLQVSSESVLNNTISAGRRLRKTFTEIKPANDDIVSQAEKDETALALYHRAVREIISSSLYTVVRLEVALEDPPVLYDRMYLDVLAYQDVQDEITNRIEAINTIQLQGWFSIIDWSRKGSDSFARIDEVSGHFVDLVVYKVELSDGVDIENYDPTAGVLDAVRTNSLQDNDSLVNGEFGQVAVIVNHNSVAADCNYAGPATGKTFTFPLPTVPAGATTVNTQVRSTSPATVGFNTDQAASLSLPLILCVSGAGGANWTVSDDVTIEVIYTFT